MSAILQSAWAQETKLHTVEERAGSLLFHIRVLFLHDINGHKFVNAYGYIKRKILYPILLWHVASHYNTKP
jgi:hypothetical protein